MKKQMSRITSFIVLYAAYLAQVYPAVTSSHCRVDLPLYSIGAVIATIALKRQGRQNR